MEIYSLSFLYLFLPASILLCGLTPVRLRPYLMLVWSGLLLWWKAGEGLWLLGGVLLCDYLLALLLVRVGENLRLRRAILTASVVKSAALIIGFGVRWSLFAAPIPFGLGVLCLTSAGYVIDCYYGYAPAERNPVHLALMNVFFPRLYAGPIVHYSKLHLQLRSMHMTLQKLGQGGSLFILGLAKKTLLGDTIGRLFMQIRQIPMAETTPLAAWTLVITGAFTVCFILSGLCDMARGLGLIFGLELPENFIYPYRATSINDFFARFNVTVNRFFRRYIYLNLGGAQGSVLSGVFNILLVTILMGLWFGINLNMMMWGLYFALFVVLERYFLRKYLEQIPTLFRWLYSMAVVSVSFVFFTGNGLGESFAYLGRLFGIGAPESGASGQVLYLLASNYLVIILCAISALGVVGTAQKQLAGWTPRLCTALGAIGSGALLLVTTAFLL